MLEFYGFREHPFGVSPNPRYLYPSVQHREALASLIFGIDNQVGFAALIAEPGTGKTTLLFDVLMRYRDRASTAFVFNTQCNGQELLRHILMELQVPGGESERDPIRQHQLFTSFVADRQRTRPVVIVIDEAQHLDDSAMEALRLLSNFEAADHKLLHIILAGQPQLAEKLRRDTHTQLLQRITIISRLGRFSPEQTEECIAYRLNVAGYSGPPLFSDEAMKKIRVASAGVPREINRICLNAVYLGFALRHKQIGLEAINEVLSDLDLSGAPPAEALEVCQGSEPQHAVIESKAFGTSATHGSVNTSAVARAISPAVAPRSFRAPDVLKAFSAQPAPRASAVLRHSGTLESQDVPLHSEPPKVVKIFDEWQSNTPIDLSLAVVPEHRSPATPVPIREEQSAKTPKQEQPKPHLRKRTAIIASLFGGTVISLVLFGLNGSLHLQQPVTVGNPSKPVQLPEEPKVAHPAAAQREGKVAPEVKPSEVGSVISVAPLSGKPNTVPIPRADGGSDLHSSGSAPYRAAVLQKYVRPVYPPDAEKMRIEGDVLLKLNIASNGSVQGIKVLKGNTVLAKAAKEAVQQWRYQPAMLNGAPVSAEEKTILTFRVDDDN